MAWPGEKPLAEGFIKRDSHGGGVRVCAVCGITGTGVGGRVVRGSGGVPRTKRTDGGVRGRRQGVREPTCKKGGVAGSIRGKRVKRWWCYRSAMRAWRIKVVERIGRLGKRYIFTHGGGETLLSSGRLPGRDLASSRHEATCGAELFLQTVWFNVGSYSRHLPLRFECVQLPAEAKPRRRPAGLRPIPPRRAPQGVLLRGRVAAPRRCHDDQDVRQRRLRASTAPCRARRASRRPTREPACLALGPSPPLTLCSSHAGECGR